MCFECSDIIFLKGFNKCLFQLLRSYKRHEENKSKIGENAVIEYWMSLSHSVEYNIIFLYPNLKVYYVRYLLS